MRSSPDLIPAPFWPRIAHSHACGWTAERLVEALDHARAGRSAPEAAALMGVSRRTMLAALRRNGLAGTFEHYAKRLGRAGRRGRAKHPRQPQRGADDVQVTCAHIAPVEWDRIATRSDVTEAKADRARGKGMR